MRRRRHAAHHAHLVRYSLATPLGEEGKEAETPESTEAPESGSGEETTTTPPSESIGTVVSFEEGTLSIKLTSGTVVSGKVVGDTRLVCASSEPPSLTGADDRGAGDDQSGEDRDQGDMSGGEGEGEEPIGMQGGAGEQGDGPPMARDSSFAQPDGSVFFAPCEPTALTPETAVREAELRLGPQGAVWERVVLVS